jgi:uncharacterized protein
VRSELSIGTPAGQVSAILDAPARSAFVYLLAHGAGASMRQAALESMAAALVQRGAAVFRYNFPYMEAGKNRVDSPAVAHATVRAAAATVRELFPDLRIVAGGRSFGGRMTSGAQAEQPMEGVAGLAFLAFPLHPPAKPGVERAEHLAGVRIPMLFLQGTRDEFAQRELLEPMVKSLGKRASLHFIEAADHSFKAPKSAGKTATQIEATLADAIIEFASTL